MISPSLATDRCPNVGTLGKAISHLLIDEQGRGQNCTVEYFQRENGTDYFCCYPDDFVQTITLHDDRGQLTTRSVRQTFEIVFVYHQPTGTLETSASLPPHLKGPLEEAFAGVILDVEIGPRIPRLLYHLNRLKDRNFRLETIPTDDVEVELKRLRLDLPDRNRRITLESRDSDDVLRMVDECLNDEEVPLERVQVTAATLRFRFRKTGRRRGGSMTIDVSAPNVCNLRSMSPERAEVAVVICGCGGSLMIETANSGWEDVLWSLDSFHSVIQGHTIQDWPQSLLDELTDNRLLTELPISEEIACPSVRKHRL